MKKEDLLRAGCMVPDTLQEAMRSGRQEMAEGDEEALETYICRLLEENGRENTYFDFYFGTLPKRNGAERRRFFPQNRYGFCMHMACRTAGRMFISLLRKACLP